MLVSAIGLSQDNKGYYINDSGQRIDGFFKTSDFFNAETLEFKTSAAEEYQLLSTETVIEYGIGEEYKFEKNTVKIDLSNSQSSRNYSHLKDPAWEKRTVFLNVIVDGNATLYSYNVNGETKYFYSINSKNIKPTQLLYKKYIDGALIKENNAYRQELFTYLKCNNDNADFASISYTRNSLARIFEKFNSCTNFEHKVYSNEGSSEHKFSLSAFAGIGMLTLKSKSDYDSDSSSKISPLLGFETVIIMPSGKWAAFARLEFEMLNTDVKDIDKKNFTSIIGEYNLDAQFINLIFGPRYYFTPKIFVDGGLGFSLGIGDLYEYKYSQIASGSESLINEEAKSLGMHFYGNVGIGYIFSESLSVDLRYDTPRNILAKEIGTDFKINKVGLALRYKF